MIDRTFLHCFGVGPKKDQALKSLGFNCWKDCLDRMSELPFSGSARDRFLDTIRHSQAALENEELNYLTTALPISEHWRILAKYHQAATYFDIETTGLSSYDGVITVISAYHEGNLYSFRYNRNLDDFLQLVEQSKLLVAFNGNSFDIPFVASSFNIPDVGCPYLDLRWICYHQGYAGGLKSIEKQMHLRRPPEIRHVDGFEAVVLFDRWQKGDAAAGEKLVRYCESDVLATFLVAGRLLDKMGFEVDLPDAGEFFRRTSREFNGPPP